MASALGAARGGASPATSAAHAGAIRRAPGTETKPQMEGSLQNRALDNALEHSHYTEPPEISRASAPKGSRKPSASAMAPPSAHEAEAMSSEMLRDGSDRFSAASQQS